MLIASHQWGMAMQKHLTHKKASGFTLIELLIVIAIIGILASWIDLDSISTFQGFHMQPATITLHDLRQIEDRELFIA